jgi:hypothetical protein
MDNAIPYAPVHPPIPAGEARELMPFEAMQLIGDALKQAKAIPDQMRRAAYATKLMQFNRYPGWSYEFSDDADTRMRGADMRAELLREQQQIDPDFAIWNKHVPEKVRNGGRWS